MRFVFINQHYPPDFAATGQLLGDLCESLASEGHDIHVITSRALYDGRSLDLPRHEILNGVCIHRLDSGKAGRRRLRDRLSGYMGFHVRAHRAALRLPRADVIVTLTTPPLISLAGAIARLFRGSRFVYYVMDIYPDIAVRAGVLRRFGILNGFWALMARLSYAAAHRIVVLSAGMREALVAQGVPREKVSVVPTWADQDEVRPIPRAENRFRQEHALGDAFVVMYSGNLGTCHLYREFAEAARRLQHRDDIRFLFVGGGKRSDLLRAEIEGLPNVRFLPYQERAMLAESLSAADVHLVSLDPRYEGLLAPSKLYGIMAAGRPVLYVGGAEGDIPRVLRAAGCGTIVPPGRGDLLAEEIARMAANPAEREDLGARARAGFLATYDRRVVVPQMIRLLTAAAQGAVPADAGTRPVPAPNTGAP